MDFIWSIARFILKEAAIYAGTYVLASTVVSYLKEQNPSLTDRQCEQLHRIIDRAVSDYRKGNDITYALTAILALAVPDLDANILFHSVISEIDEYYYPEDDEYPQPTTEAPPPNVEIDFETVKPADTYSETLINKYGISSGKALRIPLELRQCLVELLETNPTCPISLEEMIDSRTGYVVENTTVLFQYSGGKPHAYLFNKDSIDEWMEESGTNPLNRQRVNMNTQYFELT